MANPVGRPPLYTSAEDLEKIIEEYFDWCDNRTKSVYVKEVGDNVMVGYPAPYTMAGLARRIGMTRETLAQYSHKDEFSDTIKAARARVQEDIETRMMETSNQAGAIFNLKNNFGYKDKTEVAEEITHKYEDLDDEQLARTLKARTDRISQDVR